MEILIPFLSLFLMSFCPEPQHSVQFQVTYAYNYTAKDKEKLEKSVILLNQTINSEEFQKRFIQESFTETNGMNSKQVLAVLLNGLDKHNKIAVEMFEYYEKSNVIGYVLTDLPGVIFQNRLYMDNEYIMASNLLHEALHLLGFMHEDEKNLFSTVPYKAQKVFLETLNRPQDLI